MKQSGVLTHFPDWPGLTHYLCAHTETREDIDSEGTKDALDAAYRKLERENPGKTYREIGRDICQRLDMANAPWQLFIGLQEVSDAV